MAVFQYTAKDPSGVEFEGTCENVANAAALRSQLSKMGYVLVKASREKTSSARPKKIKQHEVITFAYKFSQMYSAGLSVVRSLETLVEQTENPAFREVITDITQQIETGASLKDAFGNYSHLFSDFFLGMVEAGESGGKLAESLEMSAIYLEKQADLKRKVKAAFAYPVVVSVVCFVVVGCLLIFVVPIFMKLYDQLKVPLPGPTKILVNLSILIRGYWWILIPVMAAVPVVFRWLLKKPRVREKYDDLKLTMPVFAKLNRMIVLSHFTRTFAMLASVGVSLVRSLEVAAVVARNHRLTEITKELQSSIEAGNPVATSLKKYDIFPPMIVQLAASGEEAGNLAEMLNKAVDFLEKDIERMVNSLIIKLEPALTVIMGVIVGVILMAVYLPMFDYMGHLK